MKRLFIALACVLTLSLPSMAHAQDDALNRKIVKMIQVSGAVNVLDDMLKTLVPTVLQQIKKAAPQLSESHAKILADAMGEELVNSQGDLLNRMVPLYAKVLTEAEIDRSIEFYSTAEGQSLMKKMPTLMQGGMLIGQQWGAEAGKRAAQKAVMKAKELGYQL